MSSKRGYSGKFVLRVPPELHQKLDIEAKKQGLSLNQLILTKLQVQSARERLFLEQIKLEFSPLAVIQFGSSARGEESENSDIDLLIVIPLDQSIERDLYLRWEKFLKNKFLGHESHEKYSPQFVHPLGDISQASGLWLEVAMDGIVLFSSDVNLVKKLNFLKEQILQGYYLRKWSHGQPYWVKNEKQIAS